MDVIVHITPRADWEAALAAGSYRAESLDLQGFIHCSTVEQVAGVANTRFEGATGLVLLVIDPQRLAAELRYEDSYDTGMEFPHIYGLLNLDAVVNVVDYEVGPNGRFEKPAF